MPRSDERANACFQAGTHTKELWDATNSALSWAEYGDAKLLGSSFFFIGKNAGTLSTLLKDRAREAAVELSRRAKAAQATLKGKRSLTAPEKEAYSAEIFRMKERSYWLERAAKAQCGDRLARQSMQRSEIPPLSTKKTRASK